MSNRLTLSNQLSELTNRYNKLLDYKSMVAVSGVVAMVNNTTNDALLRQLFRDATMTLLVDMVRFRSQTSAEKALCVKVEELIDRKMIEIEHDMSQVVAKLTAKRQPKKAEEPSQSHCGGGLWCGCSTGRHTHSTPKPKRGVLTAEIVHLFQNAARTLLVPLPPYPDAERKVFMAALRSCATAMNQGRSLLPSFPEIEKYVNLINRIVGLVFVFDGHGDYRVHESNCEGMLASPYEKTDFALSVHNVAIAYTKAYEHECQRAEAKDPT